MVGERRDVAGTFSQRRQAKADDVQAEEQVFPEPPGRDFGGQVSVAGCKDANVDPHRRRTAESVDLTLLHRTQQLGLQPDVHLANLVEQERAAVRSFELAQTASHGPAESALLVAEQLAFQQVLGDRGAVQGDKWPRRPARAPVNVPGEDFLARAALAGDEDACFGPGHALGTADGCQHDGISGDEGMAFAGSGLEDRGNQVRIGRKRQKLAGALGNGACRLVRAGVDATRHDRNRDPFRGKRPDKGADVVRQLHEHKVDTSVRPQVGECRAVVVRLLQLGPARGGDAGRVAKLAPERADDQDLHRQTVRSPLTISVIVTPSRVSSTITTSPRATSRLLT